MSYIYSIAFRKVIELYIVVEGEQETPDSM